MTVFEKVFSSLNKASVKYLVIGGIAVNLHGYVRFTGDLDLLLLLNKENLARIDKVMKRLKYSERLPVSIKVQKWIKEKNLKAYTFNPPPGNLLQIDIIINESLKFAQFYKRKLVKTMGKLKIPVVSIIEKTGFDIETLKRWKNASTKTKLDFLDDALKFAAVCLHSKPR